MTNLDLDELERLEKEATPRPWKTDVKANAGENWLVGCVIDCGSAEDRRGKYSDFIVSTDGIRASQLWGDAKSDAELIVTLRNSFPALRDELRAAQARVKELEGAGVGWIEIGPATPRSVPLWLYFPPTNSGQMALGENYKYCTINECTFRQPTHYQEPVAPVTRASLSKGGEAT